MRKKDFHKLFIFRSSFGGVLCPSVCVLCYVVGVSDCLIFYPGIITYHDPGG